MKELSCRMVMVLSAAAAGRAWPSAAAAVPPAATLRKSRRVVGCLLTGVVMHVLPSICSTGGWLPALLVLMSARLHQCPLSCRGELRARRAFASFFSPSVDHSRACGSSLAKKDNIADGYASSNPEGPVCFPLSGPGEAERRDIILV